VQWRRSRQSPPTVSRARPWSKRIVRVLWGSMRCHCR
jgi:hypothetical protein